MSDDRRRSALQHRASIEAMDDAARMAEVRFLGKLVVRGEPDMVGEAVTETAGVPLPAACRSAQRGGTAVLWIGPNEFWIVTPEDGQTELAGRLDIALAGVHHQVADVTSYYTTIELAGPRAREMLMKLTTLDVDRSVFKDGDVAGTMFAAAQATLWQIGADDADDGPAFRLFVRRTMADYLWCLLAGAGYEWGMPRQQPLTGETWRLAR